jgi:hypothetical protein
VADIPESSDESSQEGAAKDDEKLVAEARARFKLAEEAERDIRKEALDDLEFRAGKQWPDDIRAAREASRRPCLTINKMPQFLQQITNDQRQNRPSINVHPVDEKADIETAKIRKGLIRHIEYDSNADVAYDTAFESAASCGFGYFRIITQYVDSMSFDQEIKIKAVEDRFNVLLDPHSKEPDGSDANWGFVFEDIAKDEFETTYPDAELSQTGEWELYGKAEPDWVKAETVRVAEYFYRTHEEKEIVLLSSGEVVLKEDLTDEMRVAMADQGLEIKAERKTMVPTIKWCKLNGVEVLDKTDWLGKWIPIVPVYGAKLVINGKRILEGVIRHAKDPARMYNFWKTAETEAIALAPKAPYIAAEGQIEGYEGVWESANTANHSILPYRPVALNGTMVPPPQRNSFEPAVGAITQAAMLAGDDVKATTGIYDASLGARSNETSGVAIRSRANQAQTSNFHFVDNLTRSLRHAGRIIDDLLPKIYDSARVARIIGDDDQQSIVRLNQEFMKDGQPVKYDLGVGKYDVTVDVGPSFATKRQEAAASMTEFARAVPQIAAVTADLIAKAQDWPGSQEFAERIKKTLPPGLAEEPKDGKQPIPPEVQQQMQQMSMMVEQMTGKLNELQSEKEQKLLELESRERIEMKKLEVQVELKLAELDAKDSITRLNAEIAQIEQRMSLLHSNAPIEYGAEQVAPMGAAMPPEGMNPTGGESPGLPMEQSSEDPNAF